MPAVIWKRPPSSSIAVAVEARKEVGEAGTRSERHHEPLFQYTRGFIYTLSHNYIFFHLTTFLGVNKLVSHFSKSSLLSSVVLCQSRLEHGEA
jgi:hypothetical protein